MVRTEAKMSRLCSNLIGIVNCITLLLSIPKLLAGIWLRHSSECDKFLDAPIIVYGVFLILVSLAGLIGSCCRVSWLVWVYLLVMLLLIVLLSCFTIFAFVVTNKGAGEVLSNIGYKQHRLGDYSNWLETRVNSAKNWNKIKSCLIDNEVCTDFNQKYANVVNGTYSSQEHLPALQSGCCKPSDDCGFTYVGQTNWTKTTTASTNADCSAWDNDPNILCFNCDSCKAGLLHNVKEDWLNVAILNIIFLVVLIIVYSVQCCAFRNNRKQPG